MHLGHLFKRSELSEHVAESKPVYGQFNHERLLREGGWGRKEKEQKQDPAGDQVCRMIALLVPSATKNSRCREDWGSQRLSWLKMSMLRDGSILGGACQPITLLGLF